MLRPAFYHVCFAFTMCVVCFELYMCVVCATLYMYVVCFKIQNVSTLTCRALYFWCVLSCNPFIGLKWVGGKLDWFILYCALLCSMFDDVGCPVHCCRVLPGNDDHHRHPGADDTYPPLVPRYKSKWWDKDHKTNTKPILGLFASYALTPVSWSIFAHNYE